MTSPGFPCSSLMNTFDFKIFLAFSSAFDKTAPNAFSSSLDASLIAWDVTTFKEGIGKKTGGTTVTSRIFAEYF